MPEGALTLFTVCDAYCYFDFWLRNNYLDFIVKEHGASIFTRN